MLELPAGVSEVGPVGNNVVIINRPYLHEGITINSYVKLPVEFCICLFDLFISPADF